MYTHNMYKCQDVLYALQQMYMVCARIQKHHPSSDVNRLTTATTTKRRRSRWPNLWQATEFTFAVRAFRNWNSHPGAFYCQHVYVTISFILACEHTVKIFDIHFSFNFTMAMISYSRYISIRFRSWFCQAPLCSQSTIPFSCKIAKFTCGHDLLTFIKLGSVYVEFYIESDVSMRYIKWSALKFDVMHFRQSSFRLLWILLCFYGVRGIH